MFDARFVLDFFGRVESVHILDGHRFPSSLPMTTALFASDAFQHVDLFVHSTPRQRLDKRRQYVGQELEKFVAQNPVVIDCRYFDDERPSLHRHFDILKVFLMSKPLNKQETSTPPTTALTTEAPQEQ